MLQTTLYVTRLTLMLLGECKGNTTIGDLDYMHNSGYMYMYPPSLKVSPLTNPISNPRFCR